MPIYEYRCVSCSKRINLFFRSYDEAQQKQSVCPKCGGSDLKRLISASGIVSGGNSASQLKNMPKRLSSNDPKSLAMTMRSMMDKSNQKHDDQYKEVVHRLEKGEDANSIENSLRNRSGEEGKVH